MNQPNHGLELQAPYEPDWWCLVHGTSGRGPGCPDCANTDTTSEGMP
jgi:hypothetical protein